MVRVRLGEGSRRPMPARGHLGPTADASLVRRGHRRSPVPTDSHDELRWLTAGELDQVPWLPADLAIIDRLRRLAAAG